MLSFKKSAGGSKGTHLGASGCRAACTWAGGGDAVGPAGTLDALGAAPDRAGQFISGYFTPLLSQQPRGAGCLPVLLLLCSLTSSQTQTAETPHLPALPGSFLLKR